MSRFSSLFYSFYEKNSYLSSLRADGPSFKLIMSRGFHTGLPTCLRKKRKKKKKLTNRIKFLLDFKKDSIQFFEIQEKKVFEF
jgi:hypothetical protein